MNEWGNNVWMLTNLRSDLYQFQILVVRLLIAHLSMHTLFLLFPDWVGIPTCPYYLVFLFLVYMILDLFPRIIDHLPLLSCLYFSSFLDSLVGIFLLFLKVMYVLYVYMYLPKFPMLPFISLWWSFLWILFIF